MRKAHWLSYDLGIKGDYPALYAWLDSIHAKECGDSIAYFLWDVNDPDSDARGEIAQEIKTAVNLQPGNRLYLISGKPSGVPTGGFIFGSRKRKAPWEGYAAETETEPDTE